MRLQRQCNSICQQLLPSITQALMSTGSATLLATTRRSILLLSFATFASMVAQRICDAMLPELSRVFAVDLARAAEAVWVFAVVYGLAQLIYGPLGDRLGKFRVVTFATLACSVGSLTAVFATSLEWLVLARVLTALGAAAIIPLSLAWIGDAVAPEQVQETLARVGLGTTLGVGAGQLLGGLLTDWLGWRWVFGFMTLLFSLVGLQLYTHGRRLRSGALSPPSAQRPEQMAFGAQALRIITGSWSRTVLLVAFIEGAAGFGVLAMWASHLHQVLGLSLTSAGAIVALYGLGGMLYMAVARPLIRRFGERGLAPLGVLMLAFSALLVAYSPYWQPTVAASFLGGFGFFMFHNTMQANATQMAPGARGTAVSLFAAALFMGQSIGALLAAHLIDRVGSAAVIAMGGGVVMLLGFFFAWALRKRAQLQDQP